MRVPNICMWRALPFCFWIGDGFSCHARHISIRTWFRYLNCIQRCHVPCTGRTFSFSPRRTQSNVFQMVCAFTERILLISNWRTISPDHNVYTVAALQQRRSSMRSLWATHFFFTLFSNCIKILYFCDFSQFIDWIVPIFIIQFFVVSLKCLDFDCSRTGGLELDERFIVFRWFTLLGPGN